MSPKAERTSTHGKSRVTRLAVFSMVVASVVLCFGVWYGFSRVLAPTVRHWKKDCIFALGSARDGRVTQIRIGSPDCLNLGNVDFEIRFDDHDIVVRLPDLDFDLVSGPPWRRSPSRLQEWHEFDADAVGIRGGAGFVVQNDVVLQVRIQDMNPHPIAVSIRTLPDGKWYTFPLSFEDLNELFGPPDSDRSFLAF